MIRIHRTHISACSLRTLWQALNKKADTACHRRDLLLLLIVWRLWVAREKGVMFERIQHSRLSRAVLQTWQNKLHHQRMLNCACHR